MTKNPSFQFYPADWLKDPGVRSLNLKMRGAYIDLLCRIHEMPRRGFLSIDGTKPLPLDKLSRLLSIQTREAKKLLDTLVEVGCLKQDAESGTLYNKRMVEDEELLEERRRAGQLGGLAKGKQNPSKSKAKGKQTAKQKGPPSSSIFGSSPYSPPEGDGGASLFAKFWQAYPRKKKKPKAELAFRRIKPDESLVEQMIQAINRQKQSEQWQKDGGKFIPYPEAWLNGREWEDEVASPVQQSAGPVTPLELITKDGRQYARVQAEPP